ncbi:hypothetical protein AXG93_2884s1160 [Marchantia polymorpha subsp. ruderalis]|uniref:Plant heme peroxidase family profile domain-containing protein n=1 Tax=Marchantia polymorpha subsp. ruderalis TaxID=1480154 RepID=A0A176WMB2_MARPO|nr:hypothetical protein AXG93_2884s1160 [Marchantia polymorpha subsp. ruderalis]
MASTSPRSVLLIVLAVAVAVSDAQFQLSETFYDATCPQAASIVQQKVNAFVDTDRGLAAALMRLHFHDCFVRVGGTSWPVFLGRIDGGASFADEVNSRLLERTDNFTQLVAGFARVGLDARDMIILSEATKIPRQSTPRHRMSLDVKVVD